jgi:type II secretory pathway predicted ATPase ExeA
MLIASEKYFILHAPRQTGKTSSMLALRDYLNESGDYNAIYINVEMGQTARNDVARGMQAIVGELAGRANDETLINYHNIYGPEQVLNQAIGHLCKESEKPVVLFIDEIDALIGDTLVSVLRQIRAGYDKRPKNFPISIVLCGVRDIHDYRIHQSNQDIITGGSAFNIKAESLRLGNFSFEETKKLLLEHTKETGQKFDDKAIDYIFDQTDGQPWLVNALAYEVTWKMRQYRDRNIKITFDAVEEARNQVVISRATHLDQLNYKLKEDRVMRVMLPILENDSEVMPNEDDESYCIDLGLIKKTQLGLEIANPIYREIVPRELTKIRQTSFLSEFTPDWINKDGSLKTRRLFELFTDFWRSNSEIWASHIAGYQEAAPHLVFQAFLQRVANGGGMVYREYGLGRGRTDLCLRWPDKAGNEQRVVIELKVMREKGPSFESIKSKALEQTAQYARAHEQHRKPHNNL